MLNPIANVQGVLLAVVTSFLIALLFWPLGWPAPGYLKALADLDDARTAQRTAALAATESEGARDIEDKQCRRAIAEARVEWEAEAERRASFSDEFGSVLGEIEDAARELRDANQTGDPSDDQLTATGSCGPLVFVPGDRLHGVETDAGPTDRTGSP